MAEIRDGLSNARTMKLAHTAAVNAGDVIVSAGNVLVAVNDAEADEENIYVYRGRVEFPKATGAIAAGTKLYWDESESEMTSTSTDNTAAGIAIEAQASADETVLASLHEN